jgi:hypothetical protein
MMTASPLSPKRVEIARLIEQGRVRYELPTWWIADEVATGWDGRTLREMRRDEQIVVRDDGQVELAPGMAEQLAETT